MRLFLIATFAIGIAAPSGAGEQPAVTMTLDEAVARAMDTSHALAEVRARAEGAQATIAVRRTADRPTLAAIGSYTRTNHVDEFGVVQPGGAIRVLYPDIPDNYLGRVSFQWPIFTSGRLDALERAAEADARAIASELTASRADLKLEVVRAYWALATAIEAARVLEEALGRAEAHLADVRSRFTAGLVPPNDVSSVEAQRSRQAMQLIEARNIRAGAAVHLRGLTGLPPDTAIVISEPLRPSSPVSAVGTDELERAIQDRPERHVLTHRLTAAEERQRAIAAGSRPTIGIGATFDYANPNPRIFPRQDAWRESWDASVTVHWPLWDAGRVKAEVAEATAATLATRERLADLDNRLTTDARQRVLDVDSAVAALEAANSGVTSAAEARRVVAERFNVGVATNTEVLDAQVALLQAELDRTRALANLRLAEARLDRALGR